MVPLFIIFTYDLHLPYFGKKIKTRSCFENKLKAFVSKYIVEQLSGGKFPGS